MAKESEGKKKMLRLRDVNVLSVPESELTYFAGEHGDVVPLRHFSVERLQGCNGAISGVDVKESVGICVLVYCEPVNNCKAEITVVSALCFYILWRSIDVIMEPYSARSSAVESDSFYFFKWHV